MTEKQRRPSWLLACAACLAAAIAGPAAARAQAQAAAPASARAAQLRDIATFFVPARPLSDMMTGAIDVAYHDRLDSQPDIQALEQAYPGTKAAMLAAASRSIHAAAPVLIERLRGEAIAYWDGRLSGPEAAAFAAFANDPAITEVTGGGVAMQRGDTVAGALRRATGPTRARREAAYQQALQAFARTAAGRRLIPLMSAYRASLQPRLEGEAGQAARNALAAAHRAANAAVRARDPVGPLPYPGE